MKKRGAFTFVEVCVAAPLLVVILGVLTYAMSGARRTEAMATLHLSLMESTALAMHQLRTDLRQLCFVPGQPVERYSIQTGPSETAVRLRRSSWITDRGSGFVLVDYRLQPVEGRPSRFHLVRTEYTASFANLPGKTVNREERVFRSFQLAGARFHYQGDDAKDVRVLHVTFDVVSDAGPDAAPGPFCEKRLQLTNVLAVLVPEAAFGGYPLFAQLVTVPAEQPPEDIRPPAAVNATALEDMEGALP